MTNTSSSSKRETLESLYPNINKNYKHLTDDDVSHFLEHGWFTIPNAMNMDYVDKWMDDLWVRLGMDPNDKSTWDTEYQHLPRHREVPAAEFCPEAYEKMVEVAGGGIKVERERVDHERETWYGDAFIVNLGTAEKAAPDFKDLEPHEKPGWHIDDDFFRMFLDSQYIALTILLCFSDIPENGGGTMLCEDALPTVNGYLYNENREGLDPPFPFAETVCRGVKNCKKFTQLTAKKGDIIVTHGRVPHTAAANKLHYARVIANPHISLKEPMNFNRADGNYSLVEQSILNSLGRTSLPDYKPLRERKIWYPRNQGQKRCKADDEVARMEAAALAKGLPKESVNSFYQRKGSQDWKDFERRNGFDLEIPPSGLRVSDESKGSEFNKAKGEPVYSPEKIAAGMNSLAIAAK